MHSKPTNYIREIKITWTRDQRIMWFYGRKLLIPARFGGHSFWSSGDKTFLIYHVNSCDRVLSVLRPHVSGDTAARISYANLQDHVIKGSGNFMERNFSLHIPHFAKTDIHRHCVNGYIVISVYHGKNFEFSATSNIRYLELFCRLCGSFEIADVHCSEKGASFPTTNSKFMV